MSNLGVTLVLACVLCLSDIGAANAQERWGSIVFSQEPRGGYAWGMAWAYDSHSSARSRAVNECHSRGGSNCYEIGWFRDACGALAIGDNNGVGSGWGTSIPIAENQAISVCNSYTYNCRVVISRCAR